MLHEWLITYWNKLSRKQESYLFSASTEGAARAKFQLIWRRDAEIISVERVR